MGRLVSVEWRSDVALVRIDRPPANAMDLELLAAGAGVLEELRAAAPGAVVLTGRDGFFSAGVDLKVAPALDAGQQREMVAGINRLFHGWYSFPRPVVCAVNGHAIAGGLILALCGDHRIGSTEGRLGLTELRVGLPYPAAAMMTVRAELAPQVARRLVLGGELVEMETGLEWGLLDELAPPERVLDRAFEVASALAASPAATYEAVKRQLRGETVAAMEEALVRDPLDDGWLGGETAAAARGILESQRRAPDTSGEAG